MTRLLEHYDSFWREAYERRSQRISGIAREIANTPRWRFFRRMNLNYQFSEAQRDLRTWVRWQTKTLATG